MTAPMTAAPLRVLGPRGHDYTGLAELLKGFAGERAVFVANPGNAGDALINLGMYELFRTIGLDWEEGDFEGTYPGRVVIFSGGGALLDIYPGADRFFLRNHPVAKALVLLPHTVRGYPGLLGAMGPNCHLFAREAQTRDYLAAHATGGARLYYSHDLAFYLSDAKIARQRLDWPFLMHPTIRGPWARMAVKIVMTAQTRGGVLHAIRSDAEATGVAVPPDNYDLSQLFSSAHLMRTGQHMSPGVCASTIRVLRMLVRRFDRVETNRLHMAVLSAILGKPVLMMDNSYGKNRGIYERSIEGRYPNVTFLQAPPAQADPAA